MVKVSTCGNSIVTGSDPLLDLFAVYIKLFDHSGVETKICLSFVEPIPQVDSGYLDEWNLCFR